MVRSGRVVSAGNGTVEVCFQRPEMCAQCGACVGHKVHEETVTIRGSAAVGDTVTVEMPDARIVKVSLIAYIIPLAGLMIGLLIGQALLKSDLWAAVFGIAGLGCGLLVTRLSDRKLGRRPGWQPRLLSVEPSHTSDRPEAET